MFSRTFSIHLCALCLLISFFCNPFQKYWQSLDELCFQSLQASLQNHPLQQAFWALANSRITDIFSAVFLIGSFLLYTFEVSSEKISKRLAELLYTAFWMGLTIVICKLAISPSIEALHLSRESPSCLFDSCLLISTSVPWVNIKDMSWNCCPADHGVVVLQWCAFLWYFAGRSRGFIVSLFSLLFLIPRLISGAHWLSDIAIGSVIVVAIITSWALRPSVVTHGLRLLVKSLHRAGVAKESVMI